MTGSGGFAIIGTTKGDIMDITSGHIAVGGLLILGILLVALIMAFVRGADVGDKD
jgi:hypothetical protein